MRSQDQLPMLTKAKERQRFDHVGRFFLDAHRRFQSEALSLLHQKGWHELTPALVALLPHLRLDGTSIGEMASSAAMTRQAAGQLINELERAGLVSRSVAEHDKRSVVVTFTDDGLQMMHDAVTVKKVIERHYARSLTKQGLSDLRELLQKLLAAPPIQ